MKNNLYGRNFIKKEWSGDFRWIYKERAELAPNHSLTTWDWQQNMSEQNSFWELNK